MENPATILRRGFLGVDFFFVLSGFLITTLLLRETQTNGRFSLRGFYWRRMLRIIPVYFLVVTAVAFYYIGIKGETGYLDQLPYYYIFLSNFLMSDIPLLAPTWSLSVEEQYYLVWPLMLLVLPGRAILPALILLIGVNVVAVLGFLSPLGIRAFEWDALRVAMFSATYAPILIGSVIAVILHRPQGFAILFQLFSHPFACLGSFVLLGLLVQVLPTDLRGLPNLTIHLVMAASLIGIVVREDNVLRPILTLRPVARIGEISYGVYLYHLIALHGANIILMRLNITNGWTVLALYFLLSVVISELSFRTFERFFMGFRQKGWGRVVRAA